MSVDFRLPDVLLNSHLFFLCVGKKRQIKRRDVTDTDARSTGGVHLSPERMKEVFSIVHQLPEPLRTVE